jgi:hypothetical protein
MKTITALIILMALTSGYLVLHWFRFGFCSTVRNGIGVIGLMDLILSVFGEWLLIRWNQVKLKSKGRYAIKKDDDFEWIE